MRQGRESEIDPLFRAGSRPYRWIPASLALAMGFAALSRPAMAIPTMSPKLRDREVRLGLAGNYYLTRNTETTSDAGTGSTALTVGVRGVGNNKDFHFGVEAESLYGLRHANYRYLDVGEIYAGYEPKNASTPSHGSVYVGRKRQQWSALDSYWGAGLFQPRFRWDYLNERENGLFGLFGGFHGELVQAHGYWSPIFIPEQGAPFDINGGSCRSSSPWFSCPSSSIFIFNQPTAVRFTLEVPPVKDLIQHWGAGGSIRVGRKDGAFGRLSYAHKPMNQFLLSFEGRLDVANGAIPAVIRPRVLYHDLFGLDAGWSAERHGVTGSVIHERPIRDATPTNWNTQESTKATLLGITTRTQPFDAIKYTRFEFAWLYRDGGIAPDQGPFVSANSNYFEPRFSFKNAFSFALFTPLKDTWARRFLFSTKFIVDTENTGNILVSDLYYSPTSALILNAGLDMLGSNSTNPVDFISRYQRNDRVRWGVAYVF
jgi:hypothetical protein